MFRFVCFCSLEALTYCCNAVVARGDLGVECQPEDVPILQKTIIDECRAQGKPAVVATQMMESSKSKLLLHCYAIVFSFSHTCNVFI